MAYNIELNEKLDATIVGKSIKKKFDSSVGKVNNLVNEVIQARMPDGVLNSPILQAFTDEEKEEINTYLDTILLVAGEFTSKMALINNKDDVSET